MSARKPGVGTKLYYSIGEVAELTDLPPYTLRSWEKEFPWLRPKRVRGKNRAYRPRDIGIVLLIKRLLHEERYSTVGARRKLRNEPGLIQCAAQGPTDEGGRERLPGRGAPGTEGRPGDLLGEVLRELREISALLG